MTADLTRDAFLGGRVYAWQPISGYRAATDPVFLAAACPARPGQSVIELGCGVGVASLCLSARVSDLALVGVERQDAYADLARRNAVEADVAMTVHHADLQDFPCDISRQSFDHVIANPPFFPSHAGTSASDRGREMACREDTPLDVWIASARTLLKPRGCLTLIHAADRLPDCVSALRVGFGAITLLPLQPRAGRDPKRIVLRAFKGRKSPFRLLAPFVVHAGAEHQVDGNDYTKEAEALLRSGAALAF